MSMQEVKYYRKGARIFGVHRGVNEPYEAPKLDSEGNPVLNKETGEPVVEHKTHYIPHKREGEVDYDNVIFQGLTINEAKKESRKLQGKLLGSGILRVIPHKQIDYSHQQGFNPALRKIKRKPKERKIKMRKRGKSKKVMAEE